jgi:hypothetical protein
MLPIRLRCRGGDCIPYRYTPIECRCAIATVAEAGNKLVILVTVYLLCARPRGRFILHLGAIRGNGWGRGDRWYRKRLHMARPRPALAPSHGREVLARARPPVASQIHLTSFEESEMPSKRPLCNKVCVPDTEVMHPSHVSPRTTWAR